MKIIRPIDGIEGVTTSNAPPDEYAIWEPDGRLNSFPGSGVVSVGGNLAFYAPFSFSNQTISVYDLATGELDSEITDSSVLYVSSIEASPDGNFVAYRYVPSSGLPGIKVYDLSSSQIVFSRASEGASGFISWAPNSSTLVYCEQSLSVFGSKFLRCVKVDSAAWGSPTVSANLLDESGLTVSGIVSLSLQAPRISDTGIVFAAYRATENQGAGGDAAVVLSRLSSAMAVTDTQLLATTIYPQGILANEVRSEVAIIHGGTGASFFDYADLAPIGTPATISGTAYKGLSVSLDGAEFTLQASSVQPYNRTFSLTDYSELTAMPAVGGYAEIYYATDYFLGVNRDGTYDIVDLATNALITQSNPTVTAGDIYIYQDHVYEALKDGNDKPDAGTLMDPPTWLDRGFINPLRMFDGKLDSLTTADGILTITVNSGTLNNGLALFNVGAATVRVVMEDDTAGVVYDTEEIAMRDNSVVLGWHDYFFTPRPAKKDLALIDLPTYPGAEITVTISAPGTTVELGEIVLGRVQTLGETQYSSNVGIIDSSRKERDQFGNYSVLERPFSKRAEYDVHIMRAATSGVQRILAGYRATPIVYIGNIEEEALIVFGFYRDFQINYDNFSISHATITVEGL